jgi:nucleotide-binding universal stress UspA family protein
MTQSNASLVVGHDGSPNAIHALQVAADLAESLSAPLRIIRTWGIDPNPALAELLLDESRTSEQVADALREALIADCTAIAAAHPQLTIEYEATAGPAATVLTGAVRDERMLVVGARGVGGLPGLLLGSVSDRCLHLSTRPVLVVPPPARHAARKPSAPEHATSLDALSSVPELAPGTIVVGYDGSEHADDALLEALLIAEQTSAPVAVVQSWSFDTAPRGAIWKDGAVSSFPEISSEIQARLAARVAPTAALHPAVPIEYFAVLGQPSEVLVAASGSASMLVLGSRGLGGFSGLVLGSVSLHCAHRAHCPVLVVPPTAAAAAA